MIGIDLGSNTLRVVKIVDETRKKEGVFEAIVGTAKGMGSEKMITPEAIDRVCEALMRAQKEIDFDDNVYAVTTQALRMAVNQEEVLSEIKKRTGVSFEVISGEQEAHLTLQGVCHRVSMIWQQLPAFHLVDIGGGSTEIIFFDGSKMASRSFPVGIVTASEVVDDIKEGCVNFLCQEMLEYIKQNVHAHGVLEVISTAGTATTIAALKLGMTYHTYEGEKINGVRINVDEIDTVQSLLLNCDEQYRSELVGVGREKLVAIGIEILKNIMEAFGVDVCTVIDDGLREGAAYQGLIKLDLSKY